ncbi:putative lipoprotein [Leptospira fainei serovar Hurstbridge str. BUT 6]|uniref:Lipoprotein n=2 Tax=Leptospira fainei TaxID=48782 RepID=S3V0G7_9LEPT|nr:putative lipoprotein [Leptospira fainei serovar Hurstbridge str. BUT 6]
MQAPMFRNVFGILFFILVVTLSCSSGKTKDPQITFPAGTERPMEVRILYPSVYNRLVFYPVYRNGNTELRNEWKSEPLPTADEKQRLENWLRENLKAAGAVLTIPGELTASGAKITIVPLGSWILNENSGIAEFFVSTIEPNLKKNCTDRFAVRTDGDYSPEQFTKIFAKVAAARVPTLVNSCLHEIRSPERSTYEFQPDLSDFPTAYFRNLLPGGKPIVYSGTYGASIKEEAAKLPKTITYSECSQVAGSTAGTVRCIAYANFTTPPIQWSEKVKETPTESILQEIRR